uniref:Meiosis 1 associated protein n=1 Tax=Sinocyclocheilus grahami TaxID=75366 RepID=A0A672N0J2_SINGR
MSARNRSCSSSILQACSSSSFSRQFSRVLIVDVSPPWWSETCSVLCQALENLFFLASSLAEPAKCLCYQCTAGVPPTLCGEDKYVCIYISVTVLTCQSGQTVLRQLELLVVHITLQQSLSDRSPACSLETPSLEDDQEESLMLGTEMDLQLVEGTVVALENSLKMWLHDHGRDREHLHLLLPPSLTSQVCLKCDMQERLLSPALLPSTTDLGVKTESMQDFQPPNKSLANQNPSPQHLRVVKYSHCVSVHGLLFIIRPNSCSGVFSYYILQSSGSLSLLLKPVLTRELMLPCCLTVSMEDPPLPALASVEGRQSQSRVHSRPCPPALFQDSYEEEDPLMIQ